MELAERFNLPVVTLVDTAGAYPGIGAEERGQAEAIARSTEACLNLKVPIDLYHHRRRRVRWRRSPSLRRAVSICWNIRSIQVISPEGAASILWRDPTRAQEAATSMKITAQDLQQLGIIDGVIGEPVGGGHRNPQAVFDATRSVLDQALTELALKSGDELRQERREKFLAIGRKL